MCYVYYDIVLDHPSHYERLYDVFRVTQTTTVFCLDNNFGGNNKEDIVASKFIRFDRVRFLVVGHAKG
jgi:hypothetical protein